MAPCLRRHDTEPLTEQVLAAPACHVIHHARRSQQGVKRDGGGDSCQRVRPLHQERRRWGGLLRRVLRVPSQTLKQTPGPTRALTADITCASSRRLGLPSCPGCPRGRDCLPGERRGLRTVAQTSRGMLAGRGLEPMSPDTCGVSCCPRGRSKDPGRGMAPAAQGLQIWRH